MHGGGHDIMQRVQAAAIERAGNLIASNICIGLGYTAVILDDGRAGVAYTFTDRAKGGCSLFRGDRPLAGRPAAELAQYASSADPVESAVGLTVINALAPEPLGDCRADISEALDLKAGERVGMVGLFAPLLPFLRSVAGEVLIFEKGGSAAEGLLPAEQAHGKLASCQVAVISATTLMNHTLEGLLEAASSCREVALVGASTPLYADVFKGSPVSLLAGVRVTDGPGVMRVVKEAGGMRFFRGLVDKLSVRV